MKGLTVRFAVLLFFTVFYSLSIHFTHTGYLAEQHHAPFFNYGNLDFFEFVIILLFVSMSLFFLPLRIASVSSIFVVVLYYFLYLPIFVISLGNDRLPVDELSFVLLVVTASFFIVSMPSRFIANSALVDERFLKRVSNIFFALWGCALVFFLLEFGSVMGFVGLDSIYIQRELGRAGTAFAGYLQLYFGYFLSLAVFAFGLHFRKFIFLGVGVLGCFLLYLVTAERSIFVLPAFVFVVYLAVLSKNNFTFWLSAFLCLSSLSFLCVGLYYNESKVVYEIGFYYLVRVVAIPGVLFEQYYEFFSKVGYTNFSHVSVLNLLLDPDRYFIGDSLYPQLGKIVARDVYNINSNLNSSFMATDGVAAFGLVGLLIVSLVFSIYLFLVDFLGRNWPLTFIVPAMCPLAIVLTNGSLFTVLLSFGGLAWLMILAVTNVIFTLKKKQI